MPEISLTGLIVIVCLMAFWGLLATFGDFLQSNLSLRLKRHRTLSMRSVVGDNVMKLFGLESLQGTNAPPVRVENSRLTSERYGTGQSERVWMYYSTTGSLVW